MGKLDGKVAVVTGGTSGIGYATAEELIAQGAKVFITGRNPETVATAAAQLGATGVASDQADLAQIDNLVSTVKASHDKVDILFINAGIAAFASLEQITEELFDNITSVNYKGALFTLQKFLPLLGEGSSVINLSSVNAHAGMPNSAVYGSSKAALNSLTRVAAYELAERGIRVNTVSPGPVNTPIFSKIGMPQEALNEFAGAMQQRVPVKRFGESPDIAKLVSFLASDDASFITGSEYVIDGGVNLNPILG
ncbi:MAG: SDR family oxidoreductase [Bacteroidota bacterium]